MNVGNIERKMVTDACEFPIQGVAYLIRAIVALGFGFMASVLDFFLPGLFGAQVPMSWSFRFILAGIAIVLAIRDVSRGINCFRAARMVMQQPVWKLMASQFLNLANINVPDRLNLPPIIMIAYTNFLQAQMMATMLSIQVKGAIKKQIGRVLSVILILVLVRVPVYFLLVHPVDELKETIEVQTNIVKDQLDIMEDNLIIDK